jgi:hypothetical protein
MAEMTAEEREQLRLSLLRILAGGPKRYGLAARLLAQMARSEGRPELSNRQVDDELVYLRDKGFVTEGSKAISPEVRVWRITSAGLDFWAEQ